MKKVILSISLFLVSINSIAQEEPKVKKLNYGFNLGLSKTNLQFKGSDPNISYINAMGYDLGIIMDYQFSKFVSISPQVEMNFSRTEIRQTNPLFLTENVYQIMPTNIAIKTHFQINTTLDKSSPYFIFGPSLRIDLRKKSELPTTTYTTQPNIAIDLGFGLNNQTKHFNFAPEFIYSFGLTPLSVSPSMRSIYYHRLGIVFNFKG